MSEHIDQNDEQMGWVAVRPDRLVNEETVSEYSVHQSPSQSAIFNPCKLSRIYVGHLMAALATNNNL